MQTIAESWLVLKLTGSGVALGLATALQFTPMLLAGPWGGLLADRLPKRRLLQVTQTLMGIPALTLWALTSSGAVELWMVYALILVRGCVLAVDNPARQSFVFEMVGRDRIVNAVSLNSVLVQTARIVGPAVAAGVIAHRRRRDVLRPQRAVLRCSCSSRSRGWTPAPCTPTRSRRASPANCGPGCGPC